MIFIFIRNKQLLNWFRVWCLLGFSFLVAGEFASTPWAFEGPGSPDQESEAFWQNKKMKDWSAQQVQQFLLDSPWAKTGKITVPAKTVGNIVPESLAAVGRVKSMNAENCCRTIELSIPDQSNEPEISNFPDAPAKGFAESSRVRTFSTRVIWFSSISVRRAILRQREIQGTSMGQASAALAPSNDIVLALSGTFLNLQEGISLGALKKSAYLKSAKGSKQKLVPVDYIPPQPLGDPMAFLIFPKNLEGKPVFQPEDGPVTFMMEGPDFKLECEFLLTAMRVDGKLDW